MNKQTIWTIVIVLALIAVGVWTSQKSEVPVSGETIKIGAALTMTGFGSTWGEAERNGIQLAIEEINSKGGMNGRPLELVLEDTASDNAKTVSAVIKLVILDKAAVILGPGWLDSFGGGSRELSNQYNILMMTPSASITAVQTPVVHPNIFSTWYRSDKEIAQLADYMKEKGLKTVALLMQNDSFWDDNSNRFRARADEIGLKYTEVKFNPGTSDFRTELIKLRDQKPDAIFFGVNGDKELFSLLKQRKEIYPNSPFFTTEYLIDFLSNQDYTGLLDGIVIITPRDPNPAFADKYTKRFSVPPVFSAAPAYDAMKIVGEALSEVGSETEKLREYIRSQEFDTVTFGRTKFDEIGGVVSGDFSFKKIEGNKLVDIN